jgi:secretion/DNA translocation related TadE-like protein
MMPAGRLGRARRIHPCRSARADPRVQRPDAASNTDGTGSPSAAGSRERGSGTVLAAGLALVVMMAMALMLLLAQSAVLASRAASAADLAALAAADALRGITDGEPCTIASQVAARHGAMVLVCTEGAGQTIEVRTELVERTVLGTATGRSRAGPPP